MGDTQCSLAVFPYLLPLPHLLSRIYFLSVDLPVVNGTPLQYSCPENPMDGGAWWAAVPGVAKSWTRLSDFIPFHSHALEKEMATHSSVLAWRIPGTGEPGGLPSMGSHREEQHWSGLAAATFVYYVSFCDWFLSLGVMLIRLLHHVWIFHFFSQLNNTPQCR